MVQADDGHITPKIEQPNRRTALAVIAGAVSAATVVTASAGGQLARGSPRYRECVARLADIRAAEPHASDDEFSQCVNAYDEAQARLIAEPTSTREEEVQRVGELAALWRTDLWHGDEKHSNDKDPWLERALWKAIEKLSGVPLPPGQYQFASA